MVAKRLWERALAPMRLIPSRTAISDVGSVGEEGVRLRTSMSVS